MLPHTFNPMLAKQADGPFDSENHLFEIKWDGIRCLAFIEPGLLRLQSRGRLDITPQFPELGCLRQLPSGTLPDGELVIMREGRPSLREIEKRALQQSRHRIECFSRLSPVVYMVFDLPYLKGKPLLAEPFSTRRERLQELLRRSCVPGALLPEGISTCGRQLFAEVTRLGLEGVMAKRLDGPYLPGKRTFYWLKIKPRIDTRRNGNGGVCTGL